MSKIEYKHYIFTQTNYKGETVYWVQIKGEQEMFRSLEEAKQAVDLYTEEVPHD